MSHYRVLVPFGTRPEVIKLAPVVGALAAAGHEVVTIDTGQHADPAMNGALAAELGLRTTEQFTLPPGAPERAGQLHADAHRAIGKFDPNLVIGLGDTNTVPAYALAARAAGVAFAHLEAGLRSFNQRSLEETNRKVVAACAQLHLAPTEMAAEFLAREGIEARRIRVVGNPVIDTLVQRGACARPAGERGGVVVTAHRASNVDDPERLRRLVALVRHLAARLAPVRFPVHPRTLHQLEARGLLDALEVEGLQLSGPVGYDTMLDLVSGAAVVVTDSGGLQEEAAFFGVPVVVLRGSTPRWEGVAAGSTVLASLADDASAARALEATTSFAGPSEQARVAALACPYGEGHTGEHVARLLDEAGVAELFALNEPDFSTGWLPC